MGFRDKERNNNGDFILSSLDVHKKELQESVPEAVNHITNPQSNSVSFKTLNKEIICQEKTFLKPTKSLKKHEKE